MKKLICFLLLAVILLTLTGCMTLSKMYCGDPQYSDLDQTKIGQDALAFVNPYVPAPVNVRSVEYQGACNAGGNWGGEPYRIVLEKSDDPTVSLELTYIPSTREYSVSAFDADHADYLTNNSDEVPDYSQDFYGKMYANQLQAILKKNQITVKSIETQVTSVQTTYSALEHVRSLKVTTYVHVDQPYAQAWAERFVRVLSMPNLNCFATYYCGAFEYNDYSDLLLNFPDKTVSMRGLLIEHPEWQ